jgi:hypothetical protein
MLTSDELRYSRDGQSYPEVVSAIDIPLDLVPISLRSKGIEAVVLADPASLLVGLLFVLLVMTMIRVKQVTELANLVLQVGRLHLDIVEMGVVELLAQLA